MIRRFRDFFGIWRRPQPAPTHPAVQFMHAQQQAIVQLRAFQQTAFNQTSANLLHHVNVARFPIEDDIFGAHTALTQFALQHRLEALAIQCWHVLAPQVTAAEMQLRVLSGNPQDRIHKGAPLFNVGLCYFRNGDLENGFHFLSQAGDEDLGGNGLAVRLGNHQLSRQFLIAPVAAKFAGIWGPHYHSVTGHTLDENEFVLLAQHAALRPMDGVQFVAALHRFLKAQAQPRNDWTCYLRTRALSELLVVLESSLRFQHQLVNTGELANQLQELFRNKNVAYNQGLTALNNQFGAAYPDPVGPLPSPKKTPAAVDWCVNHALAGIAAAPMSRERRGGLAAWLAFRLRNSLLHVLEDQIDIYDDEAKCAEVIGLSLGVLRLGKMGRDHELTP